jgi:hypothetical protein
VAKKIALYNAVHSLFNSRNGLEDRVTTRLMATIAQFEPPGGLDDFDSIPNQRQAWSEFLSNTFQENIQNLEQPVGPGHSQFYNPLIADTPVPSSQKKIHWRGFPLLIASKHPGNKRAAWEEAEHSLPSGERPQDEYLEWFVEKDAQGRILRVTFTCEGPEYWEAMAHGYPLDYRGPKTAGSQGDKQKVLELYRRFVSPEVQLDDLFQNGQYNRLNKWNTSRGAMHLNQRNNTLRAEINIAAAATILREDNGQLLTDADDLIQCAKYGQAGRASDPLIGADVNELARSGFAVTLLNPVGLYIDSLDTTGWVTPNGKPASQFWKSIRGKPDLTVRAVFEIPSEEGFTVSDAKIGGSNIEFGGQIAEFIDVKLTGLACLEGQFHNHAFPCVTDSGPHPAGEFFPQKSAASRYH